MNFDLYKSVTSGAEYFEKTDNGVIPHRFSESEERVYSELHPDYLKKCNTPAGIKTEFRTDARCLELIFNAREIMPRRYFAVDVFVNSERRGGIRNFDSPEQIQGNPTVELPLGTYGCRVDLPGGECEVRIVMPFDVNLEVTELALEGATFVTPIKRSRVLLAYGDSITHGYDAFYPSNSYVNRLADMLDATVFNKAIGGEVFFPELLDAENKVQPDIITVAYGTNDHTRGKRAVTERDCKLFYEKLRKKYPSAKIFAVSPIWRRDADEQKPFGDFHDVEKIIAEAISDLDNAHLIHGFDLVPHDTNLFADLQLHPNDEGFAHYAKNLFEEMKKYL